MTSKYDSARRPYPLNILILVTLISILLAIWYLTAYLAGRQTGDIDWHPSEACQLPEETCSTPLPGQRRLYFTLNSEEPTPLEPLPVTLQLEGYSKDELEALELELDLQGRDMYMGYNRTRFEHQGGGTFTATPRLGICTDEVMVWRASVILHPPEGRSYGSQYDFTVIQANFR